MTRTIIAPELRGEHWKNTRESFWAQVRIGLPSKCWEWQGNRRGAGYGRLRFNGKVWLTHRLAFTLANGAIGDGLMVCHACDNPPCCNPAHLFLGTGSDNARDSWAKGRQEPQRNPRPGSTNGNAKLSEADVAEIRALYATGLAKAEIGRRFGVTRTLVYLIVTGKAWTHVESL